MTLKKGENAKIKVMNKKILVGSRAFFDGCEGFRSKDRDYLELVENPTGFKWRREQSLRGVCTFSYKLEPVADMVRRTLESGDALLVGKFLVSEVAETIGATVADIMPLEALLPKLDKKHEYVAAIFNAVKQNGSFELTDEQRAAAYEIYKQAREKKQKTENYAECVGTTNVRPCLLWDKSAILSGTFPKS